MISKRLGFTLVELMVVIAVIGILVSIATVSWITVVADTRDRVRETDTKQWQSTFDLYKGKYIVFPAMPTGDGTTPPQARLLCLGEFANGYCVQFTSSSTSAKINDNNSASLLTNIQKVGDLPLNQSEPINNKYVGPFVYIWQSTSGSTITVNAKFLNFFETECPDGFTRETTQPAPNVPFADLLNGVPSSVYVCSIKSSFSYTP